MEEGTAAAAAASQSRFASLQKKSALSFHRISKLSAASESGVTNDGDNSGYRRSGWLWRQLSLSRPHPHTYPPPPVLLPGPVDPGSR